MGVGRFYRYRISTFCPWDVLSLVGFVPWDVCPLKRFVPWDVLSLGTFCPLGHFVPWDLLSWDVCPLGRFVCAPRLVMGRIVCESDKQKIPFFLFWRLMSSLSKSCLQVQQTGRKPSKCLLGWMPTLRHRQRRRRRRRRWRGRWGTPPSKGAALLPNLRRMLCRGTRQES